MPQRGLTAAVMGSMACCMFLAASVVAPDSARAQKKADKAEPVGIVEATVFLGPFE